MAIITDALKIGLAKRVTPQTIYKGVPILLPVRNRDDRIDVVDRYMTTGDPFVANLTLPFDPIPLVSSAVFFIAWKLLARLLKNFSH